MDYSNKYNSYSVDLSNNLTEDQIELYNEFSIHIESLKNKQIELLKPHRTINLRRDYE